MIKIRRTAALAAAALVVTIGSSTLAAADADAQAGTHTLKAIQFNVGDGVECKPHGPKCLAVLRDAITNSRPDVVLLEEVCSSEKNTLQRTYPRWNVRFTHLTTNHPGCTGPKGQVLASPYKIDSVKRYALPGSYRSSVGRKSFSLLCGLVRVPGPDVRACVTHLRADGPNSTRTKQLAKAVSITSAWRKGGTPVVIGGDFNLNQRSATGRAALRPISGQFVETDRADRAATHGDAKLDQIWYAIPHLSSVTGTVGRAGYSDHRLLRGSATFRG